VETFRFADELDILLDTLPTDTTEPVRLEYALGQFADFRVNDEHHGSVVLYQILG
jgi:hypothetical protein